MAGENARGPKHPRGRVSRVDRVKLQECVDGIERDIARTGHELVDVIVGKTEGRLLIELLIDHEHGVTSEDCALCHETANNWLVACDPVDGPYMLQVSSPGLDRPLRKREHFERFVGSLVRMRVRCPVGGARRVRGRLVGVEGDTVRVETDEGELVVALTDVVEARLQYEFP